MKKLVVAVSMFGLVSSAASAADLPAKAIAALPPSQSWAGFYIGAHGGYAWKDDPFSFPLGGNPLVSIDGFRSRGWIAGGQVSYNWQYGAMVGGLELDVSATDIKGASAPTTFITPLPPGGTFTETQTLGDNVKLLGSARGRIGFALNSDWLAYGTGGLGWERLDQTTVQLVEQPGSSFTSSSLQPIDLFGWVLGAGLEARVTHSNWIVRLEYLHYDFGHSRVANSTTVTLPVPGFSQTATVGNQSIDVVRAGLSFKFGS